MSRLAKKPITVPSTVKAAFNQGTLDIQGPKGKLCRNFDCDINIDIKDGSLQVKGDFTRKIVRTKAGLATALIRNMLTGVTEGFVKQLEIVGVGFRAQVQGKNLNLQLGFSHPVVFPIPEGIKIETPKQTQISVQGIDKEKVGNTAAQLRAIYPPEPYKGKGIRFAGEHVRRKLGKAATK